jgi:hypothetical protein
MVLDKRKVRLIRGSNKTHRAVAKEVGCSKTLVGYVRSGLMWRDVFGVV